MPHRPPQPPPTKRRARFSKARRRLLPALALAALWPTLRPPSAPADPIHRVPEVLDLQALGAQAAHHGLPLLLEFSAAYCGYCERLEDEFLIPMRISGDYRDRVIMRKVRVDGYTDLRDFDGRPIAPGALARRYRAYLTPTLVFLDPRGHELTDKIVGFTTPELFGGYLDEAIDTSLRRVRERARPTS